MSLFDCFLKIDGIEGESADSKHKGEINVKSFSWGQTNGGTFAFGGGGGAGKVSMQDFHFTMKTSKASVELMLACAGGDHIKSAVLTCRKAGKDQQEFFRITFSDILVSTYQTNAICATDSLPEDSISLNFAKIGKNIRNRNPTVRLGAPSKPAGISS